MHWFCIEKSNLLVQLQNLGRKSSTLRWKVNCFFQDNFRGEVWWGELHPWSTKFVLLSEYMLCLQWRSDKYFVLTDRHPLLPSPSQLSPVSRFNTRGWVRYGYTVCARTSGDDADLHHSYLCAAARGKRVEKPPGHSWRFLQTMQ